MIQEAIQKAQERQDPHDLLFLMEAKFGKYMIATFMVDGSLKSTMTSHEEKRLPPDQEKRFVQLIKDETIREQYNDLIEQKKQLQETQQQQVKQLEQQRKQRFERLRDMETRNLWIGFGSLD